MNTKRLYTGPDQVLHCTSCRKELPVAAFAIRKDTKVPRVRSNCRECLAARMTAKNHENHDDAQVYWWSRQIARYGLTPESWRNLFESQGSRCAICGINVNGKKRFHVDHDHENGRVRGILCTTCNTGIGALGDDPERVFKAFEYLSRAVLVGDRQDHDFAVSVNPSTSSQGNTEGTRTGDAVETTREALP
ncbi:endonuclease VII domain-containing protein [Streptomyces tubercidicus]|uniref:endonuclease VII domain-containing protein n=1 Tax=Streptomyces tubercidicus TaxID=47759 RepID=UPI003697B26F